MVAVVERPDGARIAYDVAGDPRRAPLLLLGGIGGDASTWGGTIELLAREAFVVVVDHRGIGRSEAPDATTTVATYADDALAVLDELRVERAHLYGHSFGSLVAMELAISHPERVRSVVLGAGRPGRDASVRSRYRAPLGRPWEALYSARFVEEHPDLVAAGRTATERHPHGERRQADAATAWRADGRLATVRVPVLILHGAEDRLVDVANAGLLAEAIPGAEVDILPGAGHAYHSEMPEVAAEIVLSFLRRQRANDLA